MIKVKVEAKVKLAKSDTIAKFISIVAQSLQQL